MTPASSLLLVLPLGVHLKEGRIFIERQAANGVKRWLSNFPKITLAVKLLPGEPRADEVEIDQDKLGEGLTVELMPAGWTPYEHFTARGGMRRRLKRWIDSHDYLQFAIGGTWGDWAAMGAMIAARKGRKASVWMDRVESEVLRLTALRDTGLRRVRGLFYSRIGRFSERRAIQASTLGLFHGNDTLSKLGEFSPNPFLVHNIHLSKADRISPDRLGAKVQAAGAGPLELVYLGRVHPDKGVMDWIETLKLLSMRHIPYRARWFGDGPEIEEARAKVKRLGLAECVSFPGRLESREEILEALRSAHMMLFCHMTPESPRCLIEALMSGTPIVGYASAYSEDLISDHGGGILTEMDATKLADAVAQFHFDRVGLAQLISNAAKDGHDMNDEAVFAHRSDLIKRFTGPQPELAI
jgi:glycosyltransferase involved in cell wall biosynthesis